MYSPKEDSFLMLSCIKDYVKSGTSFLEIGAGSGLISQEAQNLGAKVTAVDIDEEVVQQLNRKGIQAIQSDLFKNINDKFDLIVFNPPYLPEDKHDKQKDTTGGKLGDETILKFLKQAKKHLNKNGKILLILSSFTPRIKINKFLQKFKTRKISEEKLFFETLEVLELS